jgi:hypothetical protein
MPLETLDYLNGTFGLIFVIISFIVGAKIILRYFIKHDINFIYIGFTWILLSCGWYGTSISFLVALIMSNEGLSYVMIALLNFIPLPFALIAWLMAFTNFLYKDKQKIIIIIYLAVTIVFLGVFFYFLFTDPTIVGEKISPVDTKGNNPLLLVYLAFAIMSMLVTGFKFAVETIKFDNPETKVKGKMLLVAFPSFCIGAILDAMVPTTALTLIIFRLILMSSAIEFYGAFNLPNWMKKLFLK